MHRRKPSSRPILFPPSQTAIQPNTSFEYPTPYSLSRRHGSHSHGDPFYGPELRYPTGVGQLADFQAEVNAAHAHSVLDVDINICTGDGGALLLLKQRQGDKRHNEPSFQKPKRSGILLLRGKYLEVVQSMERVSRAKDVEERRRRDCNAV